MYGWGDGQIVNESALNLKEHIEAEITGCVLLDNDIVAVEEGHAILQGDPASLQIPDTVQGVVRSRIDHLSPDQQVLVKVAAVIGQQMHLIFL